MKSDQQRNVFLILGVVLLVIGISMFRSSTLGGACFVVAAIVMFMVAAGSFARRK